MLEFLSSVSLWKKSLLVTCLGCWVLVCSVRGDELELAKRLPENTIGGLGALLKAAMTESSNMSLRDLVEDDFEGRSLVLASPKKMRIGGSATYRKEEDLKEDESSLSDRLIYSLTLSKTLFHWGALEANRQKGVLNLEMEELKTFEAYRNLALDVRKKYLNILITRKDVEMNARSLASSKKNLEVEQKRHEAGATSFAQLQDLTVRVNASELGQMKKENALQDQIIVLARLVGLSIEQIESNLPTEIPNREILTVEQIADLGRYFDEGVERSSSVKQQSKSLEYYEKDLHIANQRLKPKIGLSVGFTQFDIDQRGARRDEELVYGGVNISWSIFDGAATRGSKLSAISRMEQVKKRFEQAKSTYRFNLERTQRLLDLNARILKQDEEAVDRARYNYEQIQNELDSGLASFKDFLLVEGALAYQEVRTHRSRADYLNTLSQMTSLLGTDPFAQQFIAIRSE